MRALLLIPALLSTLALQAADLELKSLGDAAEDAKTKRKYGPYVGMAAGASFGQSGEVTIGGRSFPLNDVDGSAMVSIEVGKSWKMKRLPIQGSVDFKGTYMATNLQGTIGNFNGAPATGDVVSYEADMNSLMFTLNASLALDLYRYRARIGKFFAGFRPYVGAGLGGGQVWYRNAVARSDSQVNHGGALPPTSNPFAVDEFINAWNWYAGVEWTLKDQYSVFFEYRDTNFGDLEELTGYSTDGYLLGFRYRY